MKRAGGDDRLVALAVATVSQAGTDLQAHRVLHSMYSSQGHLRLNKNEVEHAPQKTPGPPSPEGAIIPASVDLSFLEVLHEKGLLRFLRKAEIKIILRMEEHSIF